MECTMTGSGGMLSIFIMSLINTHQWAMLLNLRIWSFLMSHVVYFEPWYHIPSGLPHQFLKIPTKCTILSCLQFLNQIKQNIAQLNWAVWRFSTPDSDRITMWADLITVHAQSHFQMSKYCIVKCGNTARKDTWTPLWFIPQNSIHYDKKCYMCFIENKPPSDIHQWIIWDRGLAHCCPSGTTSFV